MFLHKQNLRPTGVQIDSMDTMADLSVRVGQLPRRLQPLVSRHPAPAAVVGTKNSRCRDGDENSVGVLRVDYNGMHTHAPGARLPEIALHTPQAGTLLP